MYEYFEELEYGNDDYYDKEEPLDEDGVQLGDKRKRGKHVKGSLLDKRRKILDLGYAPVLWMPAEEAFRLDAPKLVDVKSLTSYALLPDLRDRFKSVDGLATATSTKPEEERHVDMDVDEEEGDWEDEEDEQDDGGEEVEEVDGEGDEEMDEGLDPNILQTILAAKMAESGLSGADQGAFMQSLMQMMSGGGADDAALEQLTSKLLGEVEEGGADPSITQWLSKEGVNIEEEEGNDENAVQEETSALAKKPLPATDSPKDSVAESDTAKPSNLRSSNGLLPPTSVPEAPSTAGKKRKKVSFAPPNDQEQEEEANPPLQPSNKRSKRNAAPAAPTQPPKPSTGKLRHIKSKPPVQEVSRAKNASAYDINSDTSLNAEASGLPEIAETTSEEPTPAPKTTRKRKALEIQDNDVENKTRKQLRSFAAPTASSSRKVSEPTKGKALEPMKKTTRSGRERK